MDNMKTIKDILELYDEISEIEELDEWHVFFNLRGCRFILIMPDHQEKWSRPFICVHNNDSLNLPHVMLHSFNDKSLPNGEYRYVCLAEQESVVYSLLSFEEKILDAVDRLIEISDFKGIEIERELQKEFKYYWNDACENKKESYDVYIAHSEKCLLLDVYYGKKKRLVEKDITLNDLNDKAEEKRIWEQHYEYKAVYIPITDSRGIIPPHKGYKWSTRDIRNIVYGIQIYHISDETFAFLNDIEHTTQNVLLVFGIVINQTEQVFSARVYFKNTVKKPLFEKLCNDIKKIEPILSGRKDYRYLNQQIGNDKTNCSKKIALIGAGSLGSYVAQELVKNGILNLRIYDDDILEEANIMRWAYSGFGIGNKKSPTLALALNWTHPEINVEWIDHDFTEREITDVVNTFDMIIFTIGNSDSQLRFNSALKNSDCKIPVIYAWLEAGGEFSHVLFVDYQNAGCYECLYTDENGDAVNNRATKSLYISENTIQNGCGGTRVAYGTLPLLRTTAVVLDVMKQYWDGKLNHSKLIDIDSRQIAESDISFPIARCGCCGNKE